MLGLFNGNNNPTTATPNQFLLADTLASEVNNDLVAQNGQFEHNWFNRGGDVTLDRTDIEFGEINNTYINNEFDATIIEVGYHDDQLDAELLRDPRVREALARATYQGVVRFFRSVDGTTPVVMLPGAVSNVRAETVSPGAVRLSWTPPAANSYDGDAATGYRIYTSLDGYGFDGGTYVAGGSSVSHTMTGLDVAEGVHYFKLVAVNAGGESTGSEVVAALPVVGSSRVLIVNGFDRIERLLNPRQSYPGGTLDRVRPRSSNSFDYAVQVAEAIESYSQPITVDTAANEAIIDGSIRLGDYDSVVWILGEESSADSTFDDSEQAAVEAYVAAGGNLFATGSEIGWDLDQLGNGRGFYNNVLRADYQADDAATYNVRGGAGSLFEGLSFTFDDGTLFYDVTYPDVVRPVGGSISSLLYVGGVGGRPRFSISLQTAAADS